jgi:hypothetical protein
MIFSTVVSGTERNIPSGPQSQLQKIRESMTTSSERPSRCPIILGSSRLPIAMFIAR